MGQQTTTTDHAMPRRAYSYQRVSQEKRHHRGDSLPRQEGFAESLARENGWTLDTVTKFVDRNKSGLRGANRGPTGALSRFLASVDEGGVLPGSVLIVEHLDRLSREDVDTAYDLFRSILRAGVWIATQTPLRVYRAGERQSIMDIMEPIWMMYLAHDESEKKSVRVSSAWRSQRAAARANKRPTQARGPRWLRRVGEGWEVIPERAEVVRRIVSELSEGRGCGEVAARLNAEGGAALELTVNGTWRGSAVHQLATSRTLLGEYQPHRVEGGRRVAEGEPIPGFYPAVETEERVATLRRALTGRKGRRGRPASAGAVNVLRGLVNDQRVTLPMSLQTVNSHGKPKRYLSVGSVAGCLRVPYDVVADAVLGLLAQLGPADVIPADGRREDAEREIAALTARHVALSARRAALQAGLADPEQDADALLSGLSAVKAALKDTDEQRERLQAETFSGAGEALGTAQALAALRARTEGDERRETERRLQGALPALIERIDVTAERIHARARVVRLAVHLKAGGVRRIVLDPRVGS